MHQVSLDDLSFARFSELLQTRFRVVLGEGGSIDLTLAKARLIRPRAAGSPGESFSLVFQGPADRFLAQQIYRFEHERIGAFDLFIVPIGSTGAETQYEAVFNRHHG